MSQIELRGVSKRYGDTAVLDGIDLSVEHGSIVAVLGPSGSGKTTLLRLIAGFERADEGRIMIGEQVVDDGRRTVRARDRGIGYVPQEGALFPHLTVAKNVSFGLPRDQRGDVGDLIDLVGLRDLTRRYPHQLSGGQQQRVALARALAIRPSVVLLDEPFGALDESLRASLRRDVVRILTSFGTTTILVTHDQDEALTLADEVAILDDRRIVACADARTLYREPPELAVASAIGEVNILPAVLSGTRAQCALGSLPALARESLPDGGPCQILIRPEQILLSAAPSADLAHATVGEIEYHGHDAMVRLTLDAPGSPTVLARTPGTLALAKDQQVQITVIGAVQAWKRVDPHGPPAEPAEP